VIVRLDTGLLFKEYILFLKNKFKNNFCLFQLRGHLCQFELMKEITEVSDLNSTQTEDFNKSTEPNITNISREKNESEVVSDLKESYEPVQTVYVHTNTCASNTCLNGSSYKTPFFAFQFLVSNSI